MEAGIEGDPVTTETGIEGMVCCTDSHGAVTIEQWCFSDFASDTLGLPQNHGEFPW